MTLLPLFFHAAFRTVVDHITSHAADWTLTWHHPGICLSIWLAPAVAAHFLAIHSRRRTRSPTSISFDSSTEKLAAHAGASCGCVCELYFLLSCAAAFARTIDQRSFVRTPTQLSRPTGDDVTIRRI